MNKARYYLADIHRISVGYIELTEVTGAKNHRHARELDKQTGYKYSIVKESDDGEFCIWMGRTQYEQSLGKILYAIPWRDFFSADLDEACEGIILERGGSWRTAL